MFYCWHSWWIQQNMMWYEYVCVSISFPFVVMGNQNSPFDAYQCQNIYSHPYRRSCLTKCYWLLHMATHTYTMVRCKRKLSHMSKKVACKKFTHYVTIKILPTFLNTTICSLSGSNCAHYNILRCWSEFTLFFPQFRLWKMLC